eukprot:12906536-Prorocentrum_lima.AAC.1
MYNQQLAWDGSSEPIDLLASTDIFRMNKIDQRLMAATKTLGLMQGQLLRQDAWVAAPPIAGISDLALSIWRGNLDPNAKIIVTQEK